MLALPPIVKILALVGWAVLELGTEGIKAYNLRKQIKLNEIKEKAKEKPNA